MNTPAISNPPRFVTSICIFAILAIVAIAGCVSCATNTGDPKKDARGRATNQALAEAGKVLGKVAVQALFTVVTQEATGGKVDWQQAGAGALWANVNLADTQAAIHRIVMAHSGGNAPETAKAAAEAAGPNVTPEKVNAIAAVISTATGAPPPVK